MGGLEPGKGKGDRGKDGRPETITFSKVGLESSLPEKTLEAAGKIIVVVSEVSLLSMYSVLSIYRMDRFDPFSIRVVSSSGEQCRSFCSDADSKQGPHVRLF
jgi:hypothetical protein